MTGRFRAATAAVVLVATGALAGCGGGFSSAPPSPPSNAVRTYVALGDEFTAAPGSADATDDSGCQRSASNYPALLGKALHVTHVKDVSCTGATTGSLTSDQRPTKGKPAVPPQFDALAKDTDLVTMGIGIEDHDLVRHVLQICLALPCGDNVPPQTIIGDVSTMATALTAAVRVVQDRAPDSYIVLVGYPTIVPDTGTCRDLPKLTQDARDAANRVLDEINRDIASAARETGAGFLDVAQLSRGHELCSRDPWIEATRADDGSFAYRPAAAEQRAVAEALASLVRNR